MGRYRIPGHLAIIGLLRLVRRTQSRSMTANFNSTPRLQSG